MLLRKGALEALGRQLDFCRNFLTLNKMGVDVRLRVNGAGYYVLSVAPFGGGGAKHRDAGRRNRFRVSGGPRLGVTCRSPQWRFALSLCGGRFAPVRLPQNFFGEEGGGVGFRGNYRDTACGLGQRLGQTVEAGTGGLG